MSFGSGTKLAVKTLPFAWSLLTTGLRTVRDESRGDKVMSKLLRLFFATAALLVCNIALAVPIIGQINPIAVYKDTPGSFGLTYDSARDVMWYSTFGGPTALSFKPFKDFTPAEIAAMPVVNGLPVVDNANANHGTLSTPLPVGGSALAYDAPTDQIVMNNALTGNTIGFDPVTGGNGGNYGFGEGILTDGLDVGPTGTLWHSRDGFTGLIYKDGVLFADENPAQTTLALWSVMGIPSVTDFWSGVQQIGGSLYAVAVQTNADVPNSRTIVRFDAVTGELLAYDPDGYEHARRWEDLGYDGRYLYAADLRGNDFGGDGLGQIFVFDLGGGLKPMPEPGTLTLLLAGLVAVGVRRRRRVPPA
jgi:hypothetical protein